MKPLKESPESVCDRLRAIARQRPTPESRRYVEEMLRHKWQSVNVIAAYTLGYWGDRESVEALG